MKTIIPLKINIAIINNKLKENEICIVLKCFSEKNVNFKIGFKEVGFVFETVKDSVFFQSNLIKKFKQKNFSLIIKKNLYKFFIFGNNFFFLSDFFFLKIFIHFYIVIYLY